MTFDEPMSEKCRWLVAELMRLFVPWGVKVRVEWRPNPFSPKTRALHVLLNKRIERLTFQPDPAAARFAESIEANTFGLAWALGEGDIETASYLALEVEKLFSKFFLGFHKETARTFEPRAAVLAAGDRA